MKVHLIKTESIEANEITYPLFAFAFNPICVRIKTTEQTSVMLSIEKEGETNPIEITREAFKTNDENYVVFDLSAITRSLFDRTEFHKIGPVEREKEEGSIETGINKVFSTYRDNILYKNLSFRVAVGSNKFNKNFIIPVVWGAMQIGETYSQSKNLKMFRGYPFTVPFFFTYLNSKENVDKSGKAMVYAKADNGDFYDGVELEKGKYNLKPEKGLIPQKRLTIWVDNSKNDTLLSTFDCYFDYTFQALTANSFLINVDVLDTCGDKGYYLRWINSHGEYCYWFFKPQVESTKIENKSVEFDQYYTTVDYTENYHVGTGKSVGKTVEKTVQLYADFVDSVDFDFLMGLVQSPVVDLYMGNTRGTDKWMSVNIQPATFPKGKEHLQDFSFILEYPRTQVQSL